MHSPAAYSLVLGNVFFFFFGGGGGGRGGEGEGDNLKKNIDQKWALLPDVPPSWQVSKNILFHQLFVILLAYTISCIQVVLGQKKKPLIFFFL